MTAAHHAAAAPDGIAGAADLDRYLDRVAGLRASDVTSRKLLALTAADDYDMREVVRCVECDPALTARLLRVVNGARYGLRHRVTGVRRAAAYVGRRSLRLLAVTFSLTDRFGGGGRLHAEVWRRAAVSAAAAAELAKAGPGGHAGGQSGGVPADEAYTAALLSDVGVMLLAGYSPNDYPDLHAGLPHGDALLLAERARFGADHAEVGGRFLAAWGLPEELAAAAAGHHGGFDPALTGNFTALDLIVRTADRVAEAVLSPSPATVHAADELLRTRFPARRTSRVLAGVLNAAAEDADLYAGAAPPDRIATTVAWAEHLACPDLRLEAATTGLGVRSAARTAA